jgi:hypothetical protein
MDNTLANIKETKDVSEKMTKTSLQMWNLLKVLNKGMNLKNLKSINDVYDYQANIVEEITYFHDLRGDNDIDIKSKSYSSELESANLSVESIPENVDHTADKVIDTDIDDQSYVVDDD